MSNRPSLRPPRPNRAWDTARALLLSRAMAAAGPPRVPFEPGPPQPGVPRGRGSRAILAYPLPRTVLPAAPPVVLPAPARLRPRRPPPPPPPRGAAGMHVPPCPRDGGAPAVAGWRRGAPDDPPANKVTRESCSWRQRGLSEL